MLLPDRTKDEAFNALRRQRVLEAISPRELAYVQQVCHPEERTTKVIAEQMGVSVHTVEGYGKSLRKKFGVLTKHGLVLFAYAWGLQPLPAWRHAAEAEHSAPPATAPWMPVPLPDGNAAQLGA